ncbi:hypothetical protein IP91_04505 [Pseudoduganella lurida]|uniref:DUF1993 family protein n=1 Tax=Pseudoduganella lurida TaxID=1036180 RepID=A0A562R0J7_9BURK|nr:DUF1993 domain-containing protein [Pseudoduganella lurida]TWI61906.1 hypothetical protein IP91_04505 [Pseudoduganella lurida]
MQSEGIEPRTVVPTRLFIHYLRQLDGLLRRVERFDPAIGGQRLHPDMFPLLQQARTATGFALRTSCPLAGREIVSFGEGDDSFASLYRELDDTLRYLAAIPDAAFDGMAARTIDTTAGFAQLRLGGAAYYTMYCLPNFFFHYSMVYAIARQAGVPVGKGDFDGYHGYPAGFSFEA